MLDFSTKSNHLWNFNGTFDFPENVRLGDTITHDGHMFVWRDEGWEDCGLYDVPVNSKTIKVNTADYNTAYIDTDEILEERIMEKVEELLSKQKPVFVKMTCHNCGAGVYQKADDHIFKCKFCRTTYFVGTEMIRDGEGGRNDG